MERALRWKTIVLAALVLLSAATLAPSVVGDEALPGWFARMFSKKVKLGLDLQGGLHIVYRVDLDKVVDDKAGELKRDIEAKLGDQKILAHVETPRPNPNAGVPLGAVFLVPDKDGEAGKIDRKFLDDYEESLVKMDCPADRKAAICMRVAPEFADKQKSSAIDQAKRTISDRVDRSGVADPTIVKKGDDIVVELPGTDDKENERLRGIISRTALLEFKIVDDGNPFMEKLAAHIQQDPAATERGIKAEPDAWTNENSDTTHHDYYLTAPDRNESVAKADAERYGCNTRNQVPIDGKYKCLVTGRTVLQEYLRGLTDFQPDDDHQFGFEEIQPRTIALQGRAVEKRWRSYFMHRTAELTGTAVSDANVFWDQTTNRPEVLVSFNRAGARRFGDLTSKNVGRKMAIILDEKVQSAPVIQTAITGGKSNITMGGGDPRAVQTAAEDLVNVLRTGALPAPLVESQSSQVGALLGQDAIDRAKLSMAVGAVLVILLMLFFYKFSGVIANLAMILNVVFQVAILVVMQATLTLPGIAGLVLTIGMAVDSNIIIYERVREELRAGKSVRGAVDAGFGRAFWTVFDAHVTNFVAGLILYQYGTGPIRGFAVTLLIGVTCNLFTSTWVSRLMFDYWIGRRRAALQTLSI
jgi:preprotein translocase subunit SecD